MWDCIKCGVKKIAGTIGFCPGCFEPKEDDVPKATSGGASNASAESGEPGYIDPGADEAAAAEALLGPGGPADVKPKADGPEKPAAAPAKPVAATTAVKPPAPPADPPAGHMTLRTPAPAADPPKPAA